jgi:hypothetical protein
MEYPYLKLIEDIYWVVRSEDYTEGYFDLKCDLSSDEFNTNAPKLEECRRGSTPKALLREDWRKRLYRHELAWGSMGEQKQKLAFDALCGQLLAEDRVIVTIPIEIELTIDCPKCHGTGELFDRHKSEHNDCPSCVVTGIKDFVVQAPSADS